VPSLKERSRHIARTTALPLQSARRNYDTRSVVLDMLYRLIESRKNFHLIDSDVPENRKTPIRPSSFARTYPPASRAARAASNHLIESFLLKMILH